MMGWLFAIPKRQLLYIFLAAFVGFTFPLLIFVANLPTKAIFGAIIVGLAYIFGETIIEWFLHAAKDTFRERDDNQPKQEPTTPYAHAKVAAFALSSAISWPIAFYY